MPPVRRALDRTWVPVGALATRSAVTLPTPVQVTVLAAKSARANVIATPRVPTNTRWQSWIKSSTGSELGAHDHIDRAQRGLRGGRPVAEPVYHSEQRRLTVDFDCDAPVTGRVLAGQRPSRPCPLDRSEASVFMHEEGPISTFR